MDSKELDSEVEEIMILLGFKDPEVEDIVRWWIDKERKSEHEMEELDKAHEQETPEIRQSYSPQSLELNTTLARQDQETEESGTTAHVQIEYTAQTDLEVAAKDETFIPDIPPLDDSTLSTQPNPPAQKIAGMSSGSEASQVCITHKQKTCKRKFPGPAGVLPPSFPDYVLKDTLNKTVDVLHMANNKKLKSEDEVPDVNSYLTATDDIFTSQVWRSLLIDLGPNASTVLDTFSIRASLLKACKKLLHRGKIPLMFGIIESIDMQGSDISFVIRDPS
ncbi:CAunnamed protein product, partial [Biomphalaria glabrata]